MVHLGNAAILEPSGDVGHFSPRHDPVRQIVLIVRDTHKSNEFLDSICDFLDIETEYADGDESLAHALLTVRPIAVIADLDSENQDGFHVMRVAGAYDTDLPVMILADEDPAILGAIDAIQELAGLTNVAVISSAAQIGTMADFLCHAARDAGMTRLMRL